ncbi:MAG: LCP family protein [Microbacteriaceae bacterium]|jgi:LCP family protein required for cell wall assembly|nr:LCP family protein [Microbacteriaceae bacterium]HOA86131.1 LCP family protein [Microbacteriaceae bacterium]HPZ34607.1 LCP family protein [Microbacteriaceae bacterium]
MSTSVSSPIRYPDAGSQELMTRRGWWLVALNFLLPGSAQALAGNRRLGRIGLSATLSMWALVLLALLAALLWPQLIVGIATSFFGLLLAQALLIAYAVLWVVLTLDTLRLVRLVKARPKARPAIAALAVALMVVASGGAVYASYLTGITRGTLESIFGDGGPSVPPSDGYYNILLLGADSGDGRDSMRFDSISVVSVNADTGAATVTGIPRDIANTPFSPGPMLERYPDGHTGHSNINCGWGSGINQLVTEVEVCGDGDALYPEARANGSTPGIEATKDAAEGLLGIEIPYYVLIDMHGFAALVDALGGVTINVIERLPMGGPTYPTQPVDEWAIGWIEVGEQHMNGDTAQWYARSRYTTNDWDRMRRQRELQEAILRQTNPANVLARFQDVAAAGSDVIRTDLPQSMLPYFVDLAVKSRELPMQTIELTPQGGVDPERPDVAYIQELVRAALHPPVPEEEK